jgi:hypothetical protein
MSKVIDFSPSKRIGKKSIDSIIDDIRSIPPEKMESFFLTLQYKNEDGETLFYTRTLDPDFTMLGYLESILASMKLEMVEQNCYDGSNSEE